MKPFRKIIIAIGLTIVSALIIYFVWQKIAGPNNNERVPPPDGNSTSTPPVANLKKLSDRPIFDFWLVPDTGEIYYLDSNGGVFGAKEGVDLEISTQTIEALNFIQSSPNHQKILAAFDDPRAPQWGIFDLIDKVWRPLPEEIINATWAATTDELIVLAKNQGAINLSTTDITKNPPTYKTILKDFRLKDVRLTFKPPQSLFIAESPSASYAGGIWLFDLKTANLNLILAPEKGLTISWSKDLAAAFKFSSPRKFSVLNGLTLGRLAPTPIVTLPQKCTADSFSSSSLNLYCFSPQNVTQSTILPDDYFQKKIYTIDDLLQINIDPTLGQTNLIKELLKSNELNAIDGFSPRYFNKTLFFVNRRDGHLYQLEVK